MVMYGADVAELRALAAKVSAQADVLDGHMSHLSSQVQTAPWSGPDREAFLAAWSGSHRPSGQRVVAALRDVSRLLEGNASAQERASAVDGGGSAAAPVGLHGIRVPALGTTPDPRMPAPLEMPEAVPAGDPSGGGVDISDWAKATVGRGIDEDGAYGNQCVDLVRNYIRDRFGQNSYTIISGGGNADGMYAKAPAHHFDRVPPGGTPQPGDIVCIGGYRANGNWGHVAVVESVDADGKVHVIQQSGSNPTGVAFRGVIGGTDLDHLQGYLRPTT